MFIVIMFQSLIISITHIILLSSGSSIENLYKNIIYVINLSCIFIIVATSFSLQNRYNKLLKWDKCLYPSLCSSRRCLVFL